MCVKGGTHPKDAIIAQFALWTPLGHGEVRQDKCNELGFRELDGNRRRCRLCCRYAHHAKTSCAGYCHVLENQITSYPTRGWEHLQNSQPLIGDLTFPPPSRGCQGRSCCLRMVQTFFQPR